MKHRSLATAAFFLCMAGTPVAAQPGPGKAELPISRVVLFSSGVGYFQREGLVDGNAHIDLQFHTSNINDLLKSLILQDQGGGRISTVNYDNRDPIDKTLKSFAIDLTSNPSLGQLLAQVRGERVEVLKGTAVTLTGVIIGVEKRKEPAGKDQVIETEQLNLLTADGLLGVNLGQVERIRFLKPELEQEFRKALEVLATGHDKQKKTVSLFFLGNGKRGVRVGYITESPIWKTSYRLSLESADKNGKENKVFLQGWAIVENTTDEDWRNVRVGLVSGRPISFQMDLYEPLYMPRPIVEPELFASLRPQTYGGSLTEDGRPMAGKFMGSGSVATPPPAAEPAIPAVRKDGTTGFNITYGQRLGGQAGQAGGGGPGVGLNFRQGVSSAAVATELGEYFKYELEQPISLPRQKSSLVPIVNAPVEAAKVSIYNESVHAKFPLLGLRFKNTTDSHLMQGPVTVFEADSYAGDARITDMQPKETRLISYAVDLGTEVAPEVPNPHDDLVAVKLYKGILHATHKVRHAKSYTVKNRSEHERLVLIEHPYHAELTLVKPDKAAEQTRDVYRFEVKAAPNKPVKLEVVQEEKRIDQIALTNSDDDTVRLYVRAASSSAKVKDALERALKLRAELADLQRETNHQEQALQVIEKDQARMRANMERVPQTSEAYKRYLKKFDDQETEIEKLRGQIARLHDSSDKQRKSYESFIMNLDVD